MANNHSNKYNKSGGGGRNTSVSNRFLATQHIFTDQLQSPPNSNSVCVCVFSGTESKRF